MLRKPRPGWLGVALQAFRQGRLVKEKELCGGEARTTNNRMELLAAISALEALNSRSSIGLVTDSRYLVDGINKWIGNWKARNWKTVSGGKVKNVDLWTCLDAVCQEHDVAWEWVKGHADNPGNERADALAYRGMDETRDTGSEANRGGCPLPRHSPSGRCSCRHSSTCVKLRCVPRPDRLVPDLTTYPSNSAAPGIAGPLCPEFAKRAYGVQENDAAPGIRANGRSRSCRMPFCCTFDSDGSGRDDALAALNHVAQAPSDVPGIPLRP